MNITRRSHYIPKFYLKNFTVNNLLYEYNKINGHIERKSPRGVGWQPNFNIFIDYHLRKNEGLENFLNFNEDKAAVAIQKIIKNEILIDQEMVDFMVFMSMIKFRVPKFRRYVKENFLEKEKNDFFIEYKSIKKRKEFIEDFNKKTGMNTGLTADNFFEKVYVSDKAFEDAVFFSYMINNGLNNTKEFIKKDWYFIETHGDKFFITSDDPLVTLKANTYKLTVLKNINTNNAADLFIFPISRNLILFLFTNDLNSEPVIKGRFRLDKTNKVKEINKIIFQESYNFVYSPNLETIKHGFK